MCDHCQSAPATTTFLHLRYGSVSLCEVCFSVADHDDSFPSQPTLEEIMAGRRVSGPQFIAAVLLAIKMDSGGESPATKQDGPVQCSPNERR